MSTPALGIHRAVFFFFVCFFAVVWGFTGCASTDDEVRDDHAANYTVELDERTSDSLAERGPLSLADCTEIALENGLEAKASDLEFRIARLEKKASFANFLPAVELSYNYAGWDRQPRIDQGERFVPMYDKGIGEASLNVQVPLFIPSAWFLYGMRSRGEEIGELVTEYTRQMICLKVASLYFGRLELDEAEGTLASRVAAAEALECDMRALGDEGLVPEWQVAQAETFLLAGRIGLDSLRRARRQVESELLALMGLAPWAELNLAKGAPLADIDGSLEEAVTQVLLANPRLHIADRKTEIARSRINLAVAEFLPNIVGFGSLTHTDDSFQRYSTNVLFGLSGVISLFSGFRSVNEYKAARAGERMAFIAREEETLAVILQVIRAHLGLQTARDRSALAGRALDVAESRLREAEAREAEGLVNLTERLSMLSDRDAAAEEAAAARFRKQVSIATMMNVLGQRTFDNSQEDKDDK